MSVFTDIKRWAVKSLTVRDEEWIRDFYGMSNSAEEHVTDAKAMQLSAFFACVRIIAQTIASTSLMAYKYDSDNNALKYKKFHLYKLLSVKPNSNETAYTFWQTMVAWMLIRGDAYALKLIGTNGQIVGLKALPSCDITVKRTGSIVKYEYRDDETNVVKTYSSDRIFHIKGFGVGGDQGLSVVEYGTQTFGSAIAADSASGKLFAQGLSASGVLSTDKDVKITPEQRKDMQTLMQTFRGSKNAGKIMVLEGGMKFNEISMKPQDAELLETRRFNIEEICRWFNTPPIIIGHSSQGQTMWGSGVEQIMIAWLTLCLNPIMTNVEASIHKDLLTESERSKYYMEFIREGLLQADLDSKIKYLGDSVEKGIMTRDEARGTLNLPAMGGNAAKLTAQSAHVPLDKLGITNEPETND